MKKKLGICAAAFLTAFACCISFSACGKGVEDVETNLIIEYYDAGYGSAGFEALKTRFEQKYEGYTVTLIPNSGLISTNVEAVLGAGPSVTAVDLYFCGDLNIRSLVNRGPSVVGGYDCVLADLSDVYEARIDGTTYAEKMLPHIEAYNRNGETYYSTNWTTGSNGIAYRADYFEANGWEVPATTQELAELIQKMKTAGYVPFVWPGTTGYWAYATQVWWAQYAGEAQMADFYRGIDLYGDQSADCFYTPAFLETYSALETCIGAEENSFGGSLSFTNRQAQNYFYLDQNKICMMPNGEWLETEMSKAGYAKGSVNVRMMKAPLLSAVLYDTDVNGAKAFRFGSVRDEQTLRAVVKAVDRGETSYAGVEAEDFAEISRMRNYVSTIGNLHQAVIPAYANAMYIAKEFLKFMATDEGMQIFYDNCGAVPPFNAANIRYSENATAFEKDALDNAKGARMVMLNASTEKLFYMTELDFQVLVPETYIGSQSEADHMSAKDFFEHQYNYIGNRWSIYKTTAGI